MQAGAGVTEIQRGPDRAAGRRAHQQPDPARRRHDCGSAAGARLRVRLRRQAGRIHGRQGHIRSAGSFARRRRHAARRGRAHQDHPCDRRHRTRNQRRAWTTASDPATRLSFPRGTSNVRHTAATPGAGIGDIKARTAGVALPRHHLDALQEAMGRHRRRSWWSRPAVAAYTLTATPIYEAHAQLLLEEKPSIVTFEGSAATDGRPEGLSRDPAQNPAQSLAGPPCHRRARRCGTNPALCSSEPKPSNSAFAFLSWWRASSESPSPAKANGQEKIPETVVIDRMLSKLNVAPIRDTRIIEIRFESPDPELAARIVNTLTSTYIKQNLEVDLPRVKRGFGVAGRSIGRTAAQGREQRAGASKVSRTWKQSVSRCGPEHRRATPHRLEFLGHTSQDRPHRD